LFKVLSPGIIGGLLLPLLGTLPDAAIILVSCLGGTPLEIQHKVVVGSLTGGNTFLITIPWAIAVFRGRCDFSEITGLAKNKTYTGWSWRKCGVSVMSYTPTLCRIMMLTLLPYLIITLAFLISEAQGSKINEREKYWALSASIICMVGFVTYSIYQMYDVRYQERKLNLIRKRFLWDQFLRHVSVQVKMGLKRRTFERCLSVPSIKKPMRLDNYQHNLSSVFHGLKNKINHLDEEDLMRHVDVSSHQFVDLTIDPFEKGPADDVSKRRFILKATACLVMGTALVFLFADAFVNIITSFSARIGIPPFYISFIVAPFALNASELVSSWILSGHKKRKHISLVHSALYGAVAINNLVSLGILMFMIYYRGLIWDFSAETLVIFIVTLTVGLLGSFRITFNMIHALVVFCLFPLSIGIIALLESSAIG
ncbi:hypothetical protein SAMD00019534_079520, partial [Acytostelium subglobosum LB1]|uniref:hypothetical protein n=1 Tax=Acytostelium subglobosum LB1 TaxID=1410327 RepID=UPI0006450C94